MKFEELKWICFVLYKHEKLWHHNILKLKCFVLHITTFKHNLYRTGSDSINSFKVYYIGFELCTAIISSMSQSLTFLYLIWQNNPPNILYYVTLTNVIVFLLRTIYLCVQLCTKITTYYVIIRKHPKTWTKYDGNG